MSLTRRKFIAGTGVALAACAIPSRILAAEKKTAPKHEARWYEQLKRKRVKCGLCPRRCVVSPGKRGGCDVRENRDGKFYSLNYGYPVAMAMDPIEKKPFKHVYPGTKAFSIATVGCNIACKFCQNWDISQAKPEEKPVTYRSPGWIAKKAKELGAKTIAYTYSEPTIFCEYMIDCAKAGKDLGIESVVISNGFISEKAQKDLFPHVTAIKVDLKAFTQGFYGKVCSGKLQPVLDSLKRIQESGTWLEIVNLLIPTLNDDPDDLKRMAAWIAKELSPNVPIIFSRYHPAYKIRNIPPTPAKTVSNALQIAIKEGCNYVYGANVPGMTGDDTHCPKCKAVVVERYGYQIKKDHNGICPDCETAIPGVWN